MKRCLLSIIFSAIITDMVAAEEINHAKFLAKQAALSAFEGPDPFILRESWQNGRMKPGNAKLLPQQLFKNNTYQFWFAVPDISAEVRLNMYNGEGVLMETDTVKYRGSKNVISIIVSPKATGTYYLRMAITKETSSEQDWALIYAYK